MGPAAARACLCAAALVFGLLGIPGAAAAHVIVQPTESPAGATQLYAIAIPSEKRSDTVKVEIQFPRTLVVLQVLAPAGWQVTAQKDGSGRIISAVWDSGSAPFDQFVELHVLAQNPNGAADLLWSVIQSYADGSEVQWFGPESSQFPAAITRVRTPDPVFSLAEIVSGAALVIALASLALRWTAKPRPTAEVQPSKRDI